MFRIRRKKPYAKTAVYYAVEYDPKKKEQRPCVYLECTRSGQRIGPCWGQSRHAVERALTRLGLLCDCPAQWHKASYFFGEKSEGLAPNDDSSTE